MEEYRKMAIKALEHQKGDASYRAKMAFGNKTPEQMQQEYGQSGETCQSILDGYLLRDEKIDRAIAWLKSV